MRSARRRSDRSSAVGSARTRGSSQPRGRRPASLSADRQPSLRARVLRRRTALPFGAADGPRTRSPGGGPIRGAGAPNQDYQPWNNLWVLGTRRAARGPDTGAAGGASRSLRSGGLERPHHPPAALQHMSSIRHVAGDTFWHLMAGKGPARGSGRGVRAEGSGGTETADREGTGREEPAWPRQGFWAALVERARRPTAARQAAAQLTEWRCGRWTARRAGHGTRDQRTQAAPRRVLWSVYLRAILAAWVGLRSCSWSRNWRARGRGTARGAHSADT